MPEERPIYLQMRKRGAHPFLQGGFMMMNQQALRELAVKPMGMQATRVMFAILGTIDYENRVMVDAKALASMLDMTVPNVYRSMKVLKDAGVIERHPTLRRDWRVKPLVAWKGTVKTLKESLRQVA